MSGRTSNLSLNRVDWELRQKLLTLEGDALGALLVSLKRSPPREEDLLERINQLVA